MATNIMNTLIPLMLLASIKARNHRNAVASKMCRLELENLNLAPGQEIPSKIKCSVYSCFKNDTTTTLKIKSCLLRPLHPGCYYSEESLPKPFPHCCPVMICDPHYKEDFLHRYELEKMTSQDDIEFHLTDLDDYSGVIESYELNQRGASECVDSTGNIAMPAGQHYEDRKQCIYYSCIRNGNSLRLRVASCFHEPPGPGCHRTPMDMSKSFPKCCPGTVCKGGIKNLIPELVTDVKKSNVIPKTTQKCYIWNQHLALSHGAQVQINGGCGLYTCLGQGKLQISGCIKTAVPPGCSYSKSDVSKPFPQCCPVIVCSPKVQEKVTELPEKCIVEQENLFLSLGQSVKSKSKCALYTCLSCGKLQTSSCEKQSLIPGCHYSLEDLTKPFPKCCPELICETQTQQQVIEQVQPTDTNKDRSIVAEKSTEEFLNNHKSFVEDHYINKTTGKCSVAQANSELLAEGICGRYFCIQNPNSQKIIFSRCSAKPAQPHCKYYKGDMNQQFPRCCPVTVCRNLEVQTGQHIILESQSSNIQVGYSTDTINNQKISKTPVSSDNTEFCSYPNEKIKLKVGQHLIMTGKCSHYFCKRHGTSTRLEISSCVKKPLPAGCHYTPENPLKPFPECCPVVICMTQQNNGNLHNKFPYLFRPEKRRLIKEADIKIDISGSNTINTDILAHFYISGIGSQHCYSPEEKLNIPVGAVVNVKGKCAQYSCALDGNMIQLKFSSCSRKPAPTGCYQVKNDFSKEFPYCCPVTKCETQVIVVPPTKCIHPEDNITLTEGQEISINSACVQYSCIRVGQKLQLRQKSCDRTSPAPPGCHYTKADKSKPFPECCSALECHFTYGTRRTLYDLTRHVSKLEHEKNGVFKTKIGHPKIYAKNKYRKRRGAIAETSGKCYVWKENLKLAVGEQMKARGQCLLYSCITEDDKTLLKTYSCIFNPLQPGCSYSAEDLTRPFPECCPISSCHKSETKIIKMPANKNSNKETSGKCYHPEENLLLLPGSVAYGNKKCERYSCSSHGAIYKMKTERCMPKVNSSECTYKKGDPSKRYPDCCPVKECVHVQ